MYSTSKIYIVILILLCSCTSEQTSQNQEQPLITAIITTPIMNGNDIPNAVYELTVDAPFNNVASYDMSVRFRSHNGDPATDFFPLLSITTFPTDVIITTTDLATAFGLEATDLTIGDAFDFVSTSTGLGGTTINYNDLPEELQIEGEQAYLLDTLIVCPLPEGFYTGSYAIETTIIGAFGDLFIAPNSELVELSSFQRTFEETYLPSINHTDYIYVIEFLCGNVTMRDNYNLNIGCTGGPIIFNASELALPYSEIDDSILVVNFVEDSSGCGGPEVGEVQITLTKL